MHGLRRHYSPVIFRTAGSGGHNDFFAEDRACGPDEEVGRARPQIARGLMRTAVKGSEPKNARQSSINIHDTLRRAFIFVSETVHR